MRAQQSDHHAPETLSELMKLEVIGLCAHLTHVLEDTEKCKILLTLKNSEDAQSILDLIQMVRLWKSYPLDYPVHFLNLVSRTSIGPIHQAFAFQDTC